MQPTHEQQDIIEAFCAGTPLVIEAGAGTGKTSTLRLLAEAAPAKRGIYIAYNKAIATDAEGTFHRNTSCSTAHALAYRSVGYKYKGKLNGPRIPAKVAAQHLDITDPIRFDKDREVPTHVQARLVMEAVNYFCQSSDDRIRAKHIPRVNGLTVEEELPFRLHLLPYVEKAWEDLQSERGRLRFEHDHYLKLWALTHPRLRCDFLFLDEAQDANPVIAGVVREQDHAQRVMVGDQNQAIYAWRGAVDAMRDFHGTRLQLSQSFRFGPAIADEANQWLDLLGSSLRLKGLPTIASRITFLTAPSAVLCRSNAGAVSEAMAFHDQDKRVALVGGGKAIKLMAEAALDLQAGKPTSHPELFLFKSWGEVQEYVEDAGGQDLKVFVKLVDKFGAEQVIDTVDQLVANEQEADVVISTAHKAKGREWDSVLIGSDYLQPEGNLTDDRQEEYPEEEMRLAYVAVTRAKLALDRGSLAFVDALQSGFGVSNLNEEDEEDA